jgi:hypothetical protein
VFPCFRAEFIDRRIGVCPDAAAVSTAELTETGATADDDDRETASTCTTEPCTFGTPVTPGTSSSR